MQRVNAKEMEQVGGGLDLHQSEMQLEPNPDPPDLLVVVDYNPPVQPQ